MLNLNSIPNIIKGVNPELKVVSVFDFSAKQWLVDAVTDLSGVNEDQCMYLVSKQNGSVASFVPTQDLSAFEKARRHRVAGI